jgi:hypothetical protein
VIAATHHIIPQTTAATPTITMAGSDKVLVYHYRAGKKNEPKAITKDQVDAEVNNST